MKKIKLLMTLSTSITMLFLSCNSYAALELCAPEVRLRLVEHVHVQRLEVLHQIKEQFARDIREVENRVIALDTAGGTDAYTQLYTDAQAALSRLPAEHHPRIEIKIGQEIVLDTNMLDVRGNAACTTAGNSLACFMAHNVSHGTIAPVAAMDAELYPCGIGMEKTVDLTSAVPARRWNIAERLGKYLESEAVLVISEDAAR